MMEVESPANNTIYDDFIYACSIGDRHKVMQLMNLYGEITSNATLCLDGLRAAARHNHREIAALLWRFSLETPIVIECWMTRNKPRAVSYWQLRAPIDPTKSTKTFFFVGIRVLSANDRSTALERLCTWCVRPQCACGKEEFAPMESMLALRAEAYCYETERNSELYDPEICVETTNEYQSEVFLEEIGKVQKALPLMVSKGLCCRRKATLQPMKSAHYHVYFRVTLAGWCFSVEPGCPNDGHVQCYLRAKLHVSDRVERAIPGLRSPCIICHTSTRHKRPRDREADAEDEMDHETKRRSPFLSKEWSEVTSGEEACFGGATVSSTTSSDVAPMEVGIIRVENWLKKDFRQKMARFAGNDMDQLRELTDEDVIEVIGVLKRYMESTPPTSSGPPVPATPVSGKGYAKQVRASTVTAEQFFHFNASWWESISVCIAMNYTMWNSRDIFGFISRQRAEELLSSSGPGVFVVRPSSEGGFAVSLMSETGIQHVKVTQEAMLQEANAGMDVPPLLRLLRNAEELSACVEFFFTGHQVQHG